MIPWILSGQTSYSWAFPPHWTNVGEKPLVGDLPSPPQNHDAPTRCDSGPGDDGGGKGPSGAYVPPSERLPSRSQPQRRPVWAWQPGQASPLGGGPAPLQTALWPQCSAPPVWAPLRTSCQHLGCLWPMSHPRTETPPQRAGKRRCEGSWRRGRGLKWSCGAAQGVGALHCKCGSH